MSSASRSKAPAVVKAVARNAGDALSGDVQTQPSKSPTVRTLADLKEAGRRHVQKDARR